jgi:hypothetical protein
MKRHAAAALLSIAPFLPATGAEIETVHFGFGAFTDRTPPSGPGVNNGPSSPGPLFGPTFSSAKLSDYQVTLLNDATVFGLGKPVDGIALQRIINRVDPVMPGSMIPPSSFFQKTDILLVSEDLGLFGAGAKLTDWDFAFPVGPGSRITFDQSSSQYVGGGGPFGGGLGGMATSAIAFDVVVQSFTVVPVPEPATVALVGVGLAGLLAVSRKTRRR